MLAVDSGRRWDSGGKESENDNEKECEKQWMGWDGRDGWEDGAMLSFVLVVVRFFLVFFLFVWL